MIKYLSFLLTGLLLISLSACNNDAAYKEALDKIAMLEDERSEFESEKDLIKTEYNEVIETLNDIDLTLMEIDTRERDMENLIGDLSGKELQRELILAKIKGLKDKNVAAQKKANALQKKLNNMDSSDDPVLDKIIRQYEQKLKKKDEEIKNYEVTINQIQAKLEFTKDQLAEQYGIVAQQKQALELKNVDLVKINQTLESNLKELKKKDKVIADCARAYYVAGTRKALRKSGIVKKVGLKATPNYQSKLKNDYPIDFYNQTEIETKGDILTVLPERPSNSYKIDGNKLKVKNIASFWQTRDVIIVLK